MAETDLLDRIQRAKAQYDAMTPAMKAAHDYEQRRSFVRGMCPDDQDFTQWCKIVDKMLPPGGHWIPG